MALGLRFPVSRRCFTYRLIVAGETAKVLTMSARVMPVSTARNTRSLRSCEYGFMICCFPALFSLHTPSFILPLSSILMQAAVGYPFLKEASWAFTARLFLVVKWDSATEIAGK